MINADFTKCFVLYEFLLNVQAFLITVYLNLFKDYWKSLSLSLSLCIFYFILLLVERFKPSVFYNVALLSLAEILNLNSDLVFGNLPILAVITLVFL